MVFFQKLLAHIFGSTNPIKMWFSIKLKFFVYLRNSKILNKLSTTTLVLRNIWHEKCTNAVLKKGVTH